MRYLIFHRYTSFFLLVWNHIHNFFFDYLLIFKQTILNFVIDQLILIWNDFRFIFKIHFIFVRRALIFELWITRIIYHVSTSIDGFKKYRDIFSKWLFTYMYVYVSCGNKSVLVCLKRNRSKHCLRFLFITVSSTCIYASMAISGLIFYFNTKSYIIM